MFISKIKIFLFFVCICLLAISYGCTTSHQPIDSVESSADAETIHALQLKISQLEVEISKLTRRKLALEVRLQRSLDEKQVLLSQIEQLDTRIEYLNHQKFNLANKKNKSEIAKSNKKEKVLREEISRLNESLSALYADVVSDQAGNKSSQTMAAEIKSSVRNLNAQLDQVKRQREKLIQANEENRSQIDALIARSVGVNNGEQADVSNRPLLLNANQDKGPEIVEVFYGTNRERLVTSWGDIFNPLVLPGVLLLMFFLFPLFIKLILKEHLQRSSILVLKSIVGAAFIYFIVSGVQASLNKWQAKNTLLIQYGADRIHYDDGLPFELGVCKVSIPPTHQPGVVEMPSLMYLELMVNPDKHFVMSGIQPQADELFFANLNAKVKQSDDKDMFVFVHGFHNTFENAAFRTAQIAYDMEFTGAPVFFSWPSQGNVVDYPTDESNAGAAVHDLHVFLEELIKHSHAEKIHLIAHSMGNRVLTRAVKEISLVLNDGPIFNEIILAAPDMDAKTFKDVAPAMAKRAERVTLYASSRDKALVVSNVLHGEYQRAGESKPSPIVVNPIESIDVSRVTDGHSYIADDGHILNDLRDILKKSRLLTNDIADHVSVTDTDAYWILRQPIQ